MNNTFRMVGSLSIGKETESFKPYREDEYESGWVRKILNFNIRSGNNIFYLQTAGGCFKNRKDKGLIYVTSAGKNVNGKFVKGENFTIPFEERMKSPKLKDVAEFNKFVIDLEKPDYRKNLLKAIECLKEGKELKDIGKFTGKRINYLEEFKDKELKELEDMLAKSNNKRFEYISEWDFIDTLKGLIDTGKINDKKFYVTGDIVFTYSENKNTFYKNYVPRKIYLSDEEDMAEATVDFFFGEDALDESLLLNEGKYQINGYTFFYDNQRKKKLPAPYTLTIYAAKSDNEIEKKKEEVQVKRFRFSEESYGVYNYGVVVKLLNGAQTEEITEDDLTEEQKDSILIGELTLEDIKKELGVVYGERVTENVFFKPARGFSSGRQETDYSLSDLDITTLLEDENVFEEETEDNVEIEDEDESLFDDIL